MNQKIQMFRDLLKEQAYKRYHEEITKILDRSVDYFVDNPKKRSVVMAIPDNTVGCDYVLKLLASQSISTFEMFGILRRRFASMQNPIGICMMM